MDLKLIIRDRRHARWLKSARSGDEHALTRLYDELYDPVADYLRRRCRNPQDVEDLISAVFHRLLKNLEKFDQNRGSVMGWLMTMTRHTLIDHLRRNRKTVSVEELAEVLAGNLPDPLEGLLRTEQADQVRQAMANLPAEAREILALHYGQQLRLRHIGDLLGLSEVAVKQRISRARRTLRDQLQARQGQAFCQEGVPSGNFRKRPCLDETV